MRTFSKALCGFLLFASGLSIAQADPLARDIDRGLRRGHNGARGNERSERPGRFQPGRIRHGGNGCPEGTMQVVFSPDGLSFTILFDQFVADSTTSANGRRDVMTCDTVLPITLPENQQMEITRVDYRGFSSLPAGAVGRLNAMFNFVARGPQNRDRIRLRYEFQGPTSDVYEISSGDMTGGRNSADSEVSPCGGDVQLKIHHDLMVRAPQGQQAQLTLDSVDGRSNAVYYVNWRSCQPRDRGGNGPGRGNGRGGIPQWGNDFPPGFPPGIRF